MGVTNIGCKPTVSDEQIIGVETYIDDFDKDVYGEKIVVSFIQFIRPEQKFNTLEELRTQMQSDIQVSRKIYVKS